MLRCSDCLSEMKPVVAIDIDGTLARYHEPFGRMACRFHDKWYPEGAWDGTGEFEDWLGLTKDQYREAKLAYRQGGHKRWAPLYDDAIMIVNSLYDLCEMWITSTRPWNRLDSVDPDTRAWLERMGFRYDHLLYGDDKFGDLYNIVGDRVVGTLDDLTENYDRSEQLWPGKALLISRPHNVATREDRRLATLRTASDLFVQEIVKWKINHGG